MQNCERNYQERMHDTGKGRGAEKRLKYFMRSMGSGEREKNRGKRQEGKGGERATRKYNASGRHVYRWSPAAMGENNGIS